MTKQGNLELHEESLSLRRAWIEILMTVGRTRSNRVALLTESVD